MDRDRSLSESISPLVPSPKCSICHVYKGERDNFVFVSFSLGWPIPNRITLQNFKTVRLIFKLRSLLLGQTLRVLTSQHNPANNPATMEEPSNDGQRSTLRLVSKEIWLQGCKKSDASNVRFESHLASHSPVAKSPYLAELTFTTSPSL